MPIGVVVLTVTATVALAWIVIVYNRLVRLRNQVRAAWADIDVPVLGAVTELRAEAASLTSPSQLGQVERALEHALGRLFALQEAYPELKASENFVALQRDLVAIEEQLQYARRFYNGAVRDYNDGVQRVPDLLIARSAGFVAAEFFQARDDERQAVQLKEMP